MQNWTTELPDCGQRDLTSCGLVVSSSRGPLPVARASRPSVSAFPSSILRNSLSALHLKIRKNTPKHTKTHSKKNNFFRAVVDQDPCFPHSALLSPFFRRPLSAQIRVKSGRIPLNSIRTNFLKRKRGETSQPRMKSIIDFPYRISQPVQPQTNRLHFASFLAPAKKFPGFRPPSPSVIRCLVVNRPLPA